MEREVYVTVTDGGEYSEEFDQLGEARAVRAGDPDRIVIVKRTYKYNHEEPVEWPQWAKEWPPTKETQEECGQRFIFPPDDPAA